MAKYIVCPECEGEGFVSAIGAFTSSDMDEWYGDDISARDEFISAYSMRGGAYDEKCPCCKGERVITLSARETLTTRGRQRQRAAWAASGPWWSLPGDERTPWEALPIWAH